MAMYRTDSATAAALFKRDAQTATNPDLLSEPSPQQLTPEYGVEPEGEVVSVKATKKHSFGNWIGKVPLANPVWPALCPD